MLPTHSVEEGLLQVRRGVQLTHHPPTSCLNFFLASTSSSYPFTRKTIRMRVLNSLSLPAPIS